jgi:tape measure domain-containing protein
MPTATQNIVFSASITGTSQVVNGINQINLAMNGAVNNIGRLGTVSTAVGNILQTAFGYSAGRAIVGTFDSIARSVSGIAQSAQQSIGDFQRLGGVINIAAAREMQENSVVKERVKTGTAMGVLNKQQLKQWQDLTESWRPGSLQNMQTDLAQARAKLVQDSTRRGGAGSISQDIQNITNLQGKLNDAQRTYNQLVAAQGPHAVMEEITKAGGMSLDQAMIASQSVAGSYLKRTQDLITHAPVKLDTFAKMFQTLTGYGAGAGNKLGVVEISYQLAQGMTNFGIATGKDNEQLMSMAIAMGQVQSKGKLMAEEMNRQFNNAGITMKDVVKAFEKAYPEFGLTTQNFAAMMKGGKISGDMFIEAMRQYLNQWDEAGQRMKGTWAYIPQMLQNIKDVMIKIGFDKLFEQLGRPINAFMDQFDVTKHPGAMEGITAIGESIGQWVKPAMDWLSTTAIGQLNQFMAGWQYAGSLTGGIANLLGLQIKNWNLDDLVKTPQFQAKMRGLGEWMGQNVIGGMLTIIAGAPMAIIHTVQGAPETGTDATLANLFKGAVEGTMKSLSGITGITGPGSWEAGIKQWQENWKLWIQVYEFDDKLIKDLTTQTVNDIIDAWKNFPANLIRAFDDGIGIIATKSVEMGQAFYDGFTSRIPEPVASWIGIKKKEVTSDIGTPLKMGGNKGDITLNFDDQGRYLGPGTRPPIKQVLPNMPSGQGFYSQRVEPGQKLPYKTGGGWGNRNPGIINIVGAGGTPSAVTNVTGGESGGGGEAAPIAQISTQMQSIISMLGVQGPQAAEMFKSSVIDAATTTTTQMSAAQNIIQQMATTGYPQLAQVSTAWQMAQMAGLTDLAGILQFIFQLMMSLGLGAGPLIPGLGMGGGGGGGKGAPDAHARQGHFRTDKGRYENPFTSGFDLSYLSPDQILTATANYNQQQAAAGLPLIGAGDQNTEYVKGTMDNTTQSTLLLGGIYNLTEALPANIAAAMSGGESGQGSKKDKGTGVVVNAAGMKYTIHPNLMPGIGMAQGTDFTTTPGTSNDRYPFLMMLSGAERVKVMPKGMDTMGAVMISKSLTINGGVNINNGMDQAVFNTMMMRALAT